ncbi:hypothetical protein H8S33_00005 [Ornithinibacillus sp. BX22]|uniref:Uncharacterized protein n=1 Tax=Ornithinibacillus hominis TaxID=2763055 RepID=A0A923RF19_9BACI|nr:hypothetical protein [Ornithinibacillus hominis]MBC5635195.1 hypothetical protein [Ornithinibacillus hominis]
MNFIDVIPQFFKDQYYKVVNDNLFDRYGLIVWRKNCIKVASNINVLDEEIPKRIAFSRASSRLYYSMFYNYRTLTIESIALMLAMEFLDNNLNVDKENIIQLAYGIRDSWFEEVLEDRTIKDRLEFKSGKTIYEIKSTNEGLSDTELLDILKSKTLIRKSFFESYSVRDGYEKIRVYLPNDNSYIDWKKENSIEVSVNSVKGIELGFFRKGYDYELLANDRNAWVVTITKDNRKESVVFGDKSIGAMTNRYIWVR